MRSSAVLCLMALSAAGVLSSCVTSDEPGARQVAQSFLTRAQSDPAAAGALLAPRTAAHLTDEGDHGTCASAIATSELQPPSGVQGVTVAGASAQVRLSDEEVFLARFADGWRVTAAGCTRRSDDNALPYDCSVED